MLYTSLVPAAILLFVAHRAARPDPQPVRWRRFVAWGVVVVGVSVVLFAAPVVLRLAIGLAVGLAAWSLTRRRVRTFLPFSVAAVLVAYGVSFGWAWRDHARMQVLRGQYPVESMADRAPPPRPTRLSGDVLPVELSPKAAYRTQLLRRVHEDSVVDFVNTQGFNIGWLASDAVPTGAVLTALADRPAPPSQPELPAEVWGAADFTPVPSGPFEPLHTVAVQDFVNPDGWGYVRSRREVAGFLPHAFSRVPEAREWKVVRVELVGLLRHPEPVVYPSDRLPAMADLREANFPTRPLDGFEAAGVEAVRRGEDGFAGRRGDEVRFVGAIRSAEACVKCHGGERGDLLGAFAYRLRPAGR